MAKRLHAEKLARRGVSKLRAIDPSIPDPLVPYRFKPGQSGNPKGRSRKVRVSDAVTQELSIRDPKTGLTRAEIAAANLLSRAEVDSIELERVIEITEPGLLQRGQPGPGSQNVVIGFRYGKDDDGEQHLGDAVPAIDAGSPNGNGHRGAS